MKFEVCGMSFADFYQIKDNLVLNFDDFWSPDVLKSELEGENKDYIVVKVNDEVVGFAGVLKNGDSLELMNIVTKKSYRRKGIGKLLLEKIIDDARNNDFKEIFLEVNEKNIIAIDLYRKLGFREIGKRKSYYGNEAAILMCYDFPLKRALPF